MAEKAEQLLERYDLCRLRSCFQPEEPAQLAGGRELPDLQAEAAQDLWSQVAESLSGNDRQEMRRVRSELKGAEFPAEAKQWWDTLLAIALDAPPEELRKLLRRHTDMPKELGMNCLCAAAEELASEALVREERRRRQRRDEETIRIGETEPLLRKNEPKEKKRYRYLYQQEESD